MGIWMQRSFSPKFVRRGLKVALVVGTILTIINQGDVIASGDISPGLLIKILLNYCVPYFVSVYAELEVVAGQQR